MPISVTCQCGSRLEIDEKFLGKAISCPDCQQPLPTTPPATPPPLDLPDSRRVSGWAVLSLTLATVGAFTIVGTLAAIGVGLLALREIAKRPTKLEGGGIARAGIITGAVMTFLTIAMLLSPTAFGLDVFLREFQFATRRQFPKTKFIESTAANDSITVDRPGDRWERWAAYVSPSNQNPNILTDDLIMVNTSDNAYIACQSLQLDFVKDRDDLESRQKKALDRFYKSELLNLMGNLGGRPLGYEGTVVESKNGANNVQEITLDLRLGRHEYRFLLELSSSNNVKLNVLVAGARKNQFDRLEPDFRKAFESRKFR